MKCKCLHTKSDHIIRRIRTGRFDSYSRYMDCGWQKCNCIKFKELKNENKQKIENV